MIFIFYHLHQAGNWKQVFIEQLERLESSGLLEAATLLHIGVNGEEPLPKHPKLEDAKVRVVFNSKPNWNSEIESLVALNRTAHTNSDAKILYMNSLGVTWDANNPELSQTMIQTMDGEIPYPVVCENKVKWRRYLEYFTIDQWKLCVSELTLHDCVGAELCNGGILGGKQHSQLHYSGNFWWATSGYIRTLDPMFLYDNPEYDRFACEFWIGSKSPNYKNLFSFNKSLYSNGISESAYMKRRNKAENGRICMISMFKNESKSIGTMLESVAPYINYWVLQDNGSTDGTPDVVREWAEKHKIPGFMYKVEEGWVGFGWNRDHVLQKAREAEHNCQWIMKMDCDEILEVDEDFDWSVLNNHEHQSYDVYSLAPNCQYFRTWVWRADLPWRINHDPAHETVYIDDGVTGENYTRGMLPLGFKMKVGNVSGESYLNPTKYVSDALKLEEKMIREGTMLTDLYHFWYIGKSYQDGYLCNKFPLGETHKQEYARRCIWYFNEVLDVTHPDFKNTKKAKYHDEMGYYAVNAIGSALRFLNEHYKAIEWFEMAEQFSPSKNDHLVHLAEIYWELLDFSKMLAVTTRLIDPSRKNPFPDLRFVINPEWYVDTGKHPQFLHSVAVERSKAYNIGTIFALTRQPRKKLFVVDNFYENPDLVRAYALQQEYNSDLRFYKGRRTFGRHSTPQIRQKFEEIMGEKIVRWDTPSEEFGGSMNGVFQYCTPEDALVYHYDSQKWAAMIFLTPNAPLNTGTSFYRHKETGITLADEADADRAFSGGYYDATKFELIDTVGNVYNRCVIFDARAIHAASEYFGQTKEDSRLFHIFFFD